MERERVEKECLHRVNVVVDEVAKLIEQRLSVPNSLKLVEIVEYCRKLIRRYGTPCFDIKGVYDYVRFIVSKKFELQQAVLDRAMSCIAKYIEALPPQVYGRFSMLMINYASSVIEAITRLINILESCQLCDPSIIALIDDIIFSIMLRFYATCSVVERLGSRKLVRFISTLEKLIMENCREERSIVRKVLAEMVVIVGDREYKGFSITS